MLQEIRDKTQGWFATILLGLVCLTFALFGINYYMQGSNAGQQNMAKVNGQPISTQQFKLEFQRMQQRQEAQLGADYSTSSAFQNALKMQLLQQMVEQTALVHALTKLNLSISQQQVYSILLSMPAFQEDGKFSKDRFVSLLSRLMYSPQQFYQQVQKQLLVGQLAVGLSDSNFSLPLDVNAAIRLLNETRDVGYAVLPLTYFTKKVQVSDAEIAAYYQQHPNAFQSTEEVQLQYVLLAPQGKDPAAQKAFIEQAEELANLAYENPNSLDAAAKKLHLTIQKTDYITRDSNTGKGILASPKVLEAAFGDDVLGQGYNSEIIMLNDGSQVVIHLLNHKPAALLPLAQVHAKIQTLIAKQKAQTNMLDAAQTIATKIAQGGNAAALTKSMQAAWKENTSVNRHQANVNPRVLEQVFNLLVPADRAHPTTTAITLPNGNVAIVAIYHVTYGDLKKATAAEKQNFEKQIAQGYGKIDYTLFVDSVLKKSKIKLYDAEKGTEE